MIKKIFLIILIIGFFFLVNCTSSPNLKEGVVVLSLNRNETSLSTQSQQIKSLAYDDELMSYIIAEYPNLPRRLDEIREEGFLLRIVGEDGNIDIKELIFFPENSNQIEIELLLPVYDNYTITLLALGEGEQPILGAGKTTQVSVKAGTREEVKLVLRPFKYFFVIENLGYYNYSYYSEEVLLNIFLAGPFLEEIFETDNYLIDHSFYDSNFNSNYLEAFAFTPLQIGDISLWHYQVLIPLPEIENNTLNLTYTYDYYLDYFQPNLFVQMSLEVKDEWQKESELSFVVPKEGIDQIEAVKEIVVAAY